MMMTRRMMREEQRSKPMRRKVTTRMAISEMPSDCSVSSHIVKYCS